MEMVWQRVIYIQESMHPLKNNWSSSNDDIEPGDRGKPALSFLLVGPVYKHNHTVVRATICEFG